MGIVYRLKCTSEGEDEEGEGNTANLFMKCAPVRGVQRNILRLHDCFMRETYTFEVLLSKFREFQEKRDVIDDDGFHEYAKCYRSITTAPIETMIFEVIIFH